jgi:hypothetical protein
MKTSRRVELFSVLGLVTAYVGAAHVAAQERVGHALLAAGDHVPLALLVGLVLLVVLRVLVVVVVPGVVVARLGLAALAWLDERRADRARGQPPARP